jgi:hypothetical protein
MTNPRLSAAFGVVGAAVVTGGSWVFRPAVQTVIAGAVNAVACSAANAAGNPIDTDEERAAVALMSNFIGGYSSGIVAGALHALSSALVGTVRLGINTVASYAGSATPLIDSLPIRNGIDSNRVNLDDAITASFALLAAGRNIRLALDGEHLANTLMPDHASSASTFLRGNDIMPLGPGGMLAGAAAMLVATGIAMRRGDAHTTDGKQSTLPMIGKQLQTSMFSRMRAGIEMESKGSKGSLGIPVALMQALLVAVKLLMEKGDVKQPVIGVTIGLLAAYVHMIRVDNWASLRRSGEMTGDQLRTLQTSESMWAENKSGLRSALGNFRARRLGDDATVSDALRRTDSAGSSTVLIDKAMIYRTACTIVATATAFLCTDVARTTPYLEALTGSEDDSLHQMLGGHVGWDQVVLTAAAGMALGSACLYMANAMVADPIGKPAHPVEADPAQLVETGPGHARVFTARMSAGLAAGAASGLGLGVGGLIGAAVAVSLGKVGPNRPTQAQAQAQAQARTGPEIMDSKLEVVVENKLTHSDFDISSNAFARETKNDLTPRSPLNTNRNPDQLPSSALPPYPTQSPSSSSSSSLPPYPVSPSTNQHPSSSGVAATPRTVQGTPSKKLSSPVPLGSHFKVSDAEGSPQRPTAEKSGFNTPQRQNAKPQSPKSSK